MGRHLEPLSEKIQPTVKLKALDIPAFLVSIFRLYEGSCELDGLYFVVTIHSRPVGMTSQAGISPLPDRV